MKLPVLPCFLLVALLALQVQESYSECCNANKDQEFTGLFFEYTKCGDSTKPTPCCGYGKCNIFCCNCDGGCRREGGRRRRDVQVDHFGQFDLNGDGRVSGNEAQKWLNATSLAHAVREVQKLDKDGDGHLTRTEIGA